jgi:dTDP-4-dehydrorhamnose reductase
MKVLVIGATGMLGYSLFRNLSEYSQLITFGTVRNIKGKETYFEGLEQQLYFDVDVSDLESVEAAIAECDADIVLNCIGLIKQYDTAKIPVQAIKINSLLPHQLADLCNKYSAKLIHFSTDCVFTGSKGGYVESDTPDASDIYGRSKLLGEVDYSPHLTLRTSIIGHELSSNVSLIDWFLSQENETKGFSKAIFSGLPTCYIAKFLVEHVLSSKDLTGLHQLSVEPIDKFTLLNKVASLYSKHITINESTDLVIDRSLNSSKLQAATGFKVPNWDLLLDVMYSDYLKYYSK